VEIWYIFSVLVFCTKKNLATLNRSNPSEIKDIKPKALNTKKNGGKTMGTKIIQYFPQIIITPNTPARFLSQSAPT
jgi:hypothetical protein